MMIHEGTQVVLKHINTDKTEVVTILSFIVDMDAETDYPIQITFCDGQCLWFGIIGKVVKSACERVIMTVSD